MKIFVFCILFLVSSITYAGANTCTNFSVHKTYATYYVQNLIWKRLPYNAPITVSGQPVIQSFVRGWTSLVPKFVNDIPTVSGYSVNSKGNWNTTSLHDGWTLIEHIDSK